MFKNTLLIILLIINGILIFQLIQSYDISFLSLHIIAAGITAILSVLFLLTDRVKSVKLLSIATFLTALWHVALIVHVVYNVVYA